MEIVKAKVGTQKEDDYTSTWIGRPIYILLGNNWFCTKQYDKDKLPTYLPEIVTDAEDAWVRTTLRIKNFEEKGSRVIVSVNKSNNTHTVLVSESDSSYNDSSNSSSSSSDSENGEVYTISKRKCRCVKKKED
nr:2817_t:CDS:2 [Entrophospora candida]